MPDSLSTDIDSFYHLASTPPGEMLCQGTACFVSRYLNRERWNRACMQDPRIYCLGKCFLAPAASSDEARPPIFLQAPQAVVLENLLSGGARTLESYLAKAGYSAIMKTLSLPPENIIREVEASGLRGRGGAGFPTGRKWRAVFSEPSREKYVIANADEGDPGAYTDRFILEDDPHRLIEAMLIAGYAVGADQGIIYLRKEYPQARPILEKALTEARAAHLLGKDILNSPFSFGIKIVIGQGSYVCGEETAMLNSIEGKRPEVRVRPPYPTQCGLFEKPTLVNNIETLASIPWIIRKGGTEYHTLGFSQSRGTKLISLNSLFQRPGLYEVEFGLPLRKIVEELGGGLKSGKLQGLLIGGPLAGIVPPGLLDTPLGFEELRAIGASVGHGGMVAFDEHTSIIELIHHVFSFGAYESCGKCTPCRLGSRRVEEIFQEILKTGRLSMGEESEWTRIVAVLKETSLCGLGTGLAEFAESVLRYYGKDLEKCFT